MVYELALVIKPHTTEEIKEKVLPRIEENVKELKGKMTLKESLGKRLLAYPIDNFKEGHYSFHRLEMSAAKLSEFRKELELNQDVLRYLVVKENTL